MTRYNVKIVMLGDSSVGKTSIIQRYTRDIYVEKPLTVGVDYSIRNVTFDNKTVKLRLWDTSGQERFNSLTYSYCRGANAILLVYDVASQSSFEHIDRWLKSLDAFATDTIVVLVANKIDSNKRVVSPEAGQKYAMDHKIVYYETSARDNKGIDDIFEYIVRQHTTHVDRDQLLLVENVVQQKCC